MSKGENLIRIKLCNLKEVEEMIKNQKVVKRDKVYEKLLKYLDN